jgi:hypothetical protein
MSPAAATAGERTSIVSSALFLVSVKTPDDPPVRVFEPGMSGGNRRLPCNFTFGLLGKFESPEWNCWNVGSYVGLPVDWPKPFRSMTEMPATGGVAPLRAT